jgi:hypothetical protein
MTATRVLPALLAILAAAGSADAAGLASLDAAPHRTPAGALLTARAAAAPELFAAKKTKSGGRATTRLPENREAEATGPASLDEDSGLRFTRGQQIEILGIFAFGAGASVIMLIYGFVDFMRCAIHWLDETLTNLYGDPGRARRVPGRTQVREGGASGSAEDND